MTSSPDRLAAWLPPDLLAAPAPGRARNAARAAIPSHVRPGLASDSAALAPGAREAHADLVPADWSPPDLAALDAQAEAAASRTPEDEAFAVGLAEGLRQGEARAFEHLTPALEMLNRLAAQIETSRVRFEHDRESNLHGLALAVVHHVLQREIAADPSIVTGLVTKALELLPANAPLEVRLNPVDLSTLAPDLERFASAGRPVAVQWVPDPSLPRGSFTVDGPQRIVDGRTDVALRTLFERLDHA